jgi:hypothetical protein
VKRALILLVTLLAACTVTIKPIPVTHQKQTRHRSSHHHKKSSKTSGTPEKKTVVDAKWIESYRNLEKETEYFNPNDDKIKQVDGKFEVPQSVIDHFNDMRKVEPTPNPTPTPQRYPYPYP